MQPTYVYLPKRRTHLNLASVAYANEDRDGRALEITFMATDASESGYPTALVLFVTDEDRQAVLDALRHLTVNAHALVKP